MKRLWKLLEDFACIVLLHATCVDVGYLQTRHGQSESQCETAAEEAAAEAVFLLLILNASSSGDARIEAASGVLYASGGRPVP